MLEKLSIIAEVSFRLFNSKLGTVFFTESYIKKKLERDVRDHELTQVSYDHRSYERNLSNCV